MDDFYRAKEEKVEEMITMAVLPFFHMYGITVLMCAPIHRGNYLVILDYILKHNRRMYNSDVRF